jgi:diguanylate cyclase (GGDEF)-like protein
MNPGAGMRKPGASIRLRLFLLALVAIVPLAIERIYSIETERRLAMEEARQNALVLARQGAEKQNQSISAARSTLQLLARAYPKVVEGDIPCGDFLKAALAGTPGLKTVSVVNPQGRIVCSANPGSVGLNVSDRPFFQEVLQNGGFALSNYSLGRVILGPTVFVGYGERSPTGSVDAVFTAVLDLDWIGRVAADIAKRAGSVVLLTDARGTVLTRYPNPDRWMGQRFANHPLIERAMAQSEGVVSEKGIDGTRRVFAFTKLPGADAYFFIGLDEAQVLENVNDAMIRSYSQLAIIAALVLLGIWSGGERFFVRPIRALTQTVTQIGQGELTARAMRHALAAEFVPLASAMDSMADQLAEREAQLRATNEKLETLAQRDGLTGLANRRLFDVRLEAAWQVSVALKSPLSLIMIDIDHFKLFNDRYGHLEGDACLRSVADVFLTSARNDGDLAARYGGEEFVLLLPGASVDQAVKVAERVRNAVEELAIANEDAPHGRVTISVGVASVEDCDGADVDSLIKAADSALYMAKIRGRNRVVAYASISLTVVA